MPENATETADAGISIRGDTFPTPSVAKAKELIRHTTGLDEDRDLHAVLLTLAAITTGD